MSLMYAQMGMAVVNAFGQHSTAKVQHQMEETARKYRQTMAGISAATSLNALTANQVSMRDASVRAAQSIQVQSLRDRSSATVEAAASGVRGGSVDSAMRGLVRSRMQAQQALKEKMKAQGRQDTNQRRNIAMSRAMGRDVSATMAPSPASALLGLGASMLDIYDSNQPEGEKVSDTIAGWGRG